jgi:uncharacterized protein (DUF2141 family)
MFKILKAFFLVASLHLATSFLLQAQPSQTNLIHVEIAGLHKDKGQVLCALFSSASDFPKKADKAVAHARSDISHGARILRILWSRFWDLCFHDENSNGKMDTNFMGIPREGVGTSNNAKGHFGPPKIRCRRFSFFRRSGRSEDHDQLLIGGVIWTKAPSPNGHSARYSICGSPGALVAGRGHHAHCSKRRNSEYPEKKRGRSLTGDLIGFVSP